MSLLSVAAAIFHCGVGLKVRTARAKFILGLFPRSYFDLKSQFSRYKRIDSQNSFKYAFV